jgi:hypothetical protein
VLIVLKSGSLNLLEPSGPVKDCNGIALPSQLTFVNILFGILAYTSLMNQDEEGDGIRPD